MALHHRYPAQTPCKKLSFRFVGPFSILRQVNEVAYELKLPPQYRIHPTIYVSLLQPFHSAVSPPTQTYQQPPSPGSAGRWYLLYCAGDPNILASWRSLEYMDDREGYVPEERSWVPSDDILDPSLLTKFHVSHPEAPAPSSRGSLLRRRPLRPSGVGCGEGGFCHQNTRLLPTHKGHMPQRF